VKTLKELTQLVNGIIDNNYTPGTVHEKIAEFNQAIDELAMEESGCTQAMLRDETKDDTAIVRLFWAAQSTIRMKVLMSAAQEQWFIRGMKG
jgi:hypothetical protein